MPDAKIHVTVTYTCDWESKNRNDQRGHITIRTATGTIEATWSSTGGMGDGCDLISNTTQEFDEETAEALLDSNDLCQGLGTYEGDVDADEYGWLTLENVVWHDAEASAAKGPTQK